MYLFTDFTSKCELHQRIVNVHVCECGHTRTYLYSHRLSKNLESEEELIPCSADWDVYDATREWERQGVFENGRWRISHLNANFKEIETYPELIVVPASISDVVLKDATSFRSIGRIPSLCWFNKANGATLTRASQPKVRVKYK